MNEFNDTAPFFSVVIPIYNRAHLIKPVLESVLNQTFEDFEVLLVDDCSEDIAELESVLNNIADSRIKLFKHSTNKNGAAARNTGIYAAQGQYISFLDSDDYWPAHKLQRVKDELKKIENPSRTIIYGQVEIKKLTQAHGRIKPDFPVSNQSISDYLFVDGGILQTSAVEI